MAPFATMTVDGRPLDLSWLVTISGNNLLPVAHLADRCRLRHGQQLNRR